MTRHAVLIIGAGFSGLGAAIRLLQAGIEDVVILERGPEVGGTWRDNTYPGAACDIPSLLYSFSFAPNPEWSRAYSGGEEIQRYMLHLVERFGLRRLIRFNANVTKLVFDDATGTWTAHTADGATVSARAAIMASGPLANASFPKLRGLETYAGHKMHSARWDHGYDLNGKRVAVVGTGASAVQIVPELVQQAHTVKVFQRTPAWVLPKADYRRSEWVKALSRRFPSTQRLARAGWYLIHEALGIGILWDSLATWGLKAMAKLHLRRQVSDPLLRRQLTPTFRPGCKRVLLSNDYYPALQRANCELISSPIETLSPAGIRTTDGIEHEFDCVVFATGFDVCKAGTPFPVFGQGGRALHDEWARGAQAYKSVSVAGYPNLILTCGPNSGTGHHSLIVYLEAQLDYAVSLVRHILEHDLLALDIDPTLQQQYNQRLQERLARTTWNSGCQSWYLTEDGFNAMMYPGFASQYTRQLAQFAPTAYHARR